MVEGLEVCPRVYCFHRSIMIINSRAGIMGIISNTVLDEGGSVVGVIPSAMIAAGGEGLIDPPKSGYSETLSGLQRERVSTSA